MQTLAFDENNPPTKVSIWALRANIFVIAISLFTQIIHTFNSIKKIPIEDFSLMLITGTILIIVIDLFLIKNIVYLSDNTIILEGIFRTKGYKYEDFARIAVYNKWLSVIFIEFSDGKKYHILTREIPFMRKHNYLLKDFTHTANYLDFQVRNYFKNKYA